MQALLNRKPSANGGQVQEPPEGEADGVVEAQQPGPLPASEANGSYMSLEEPPAAEITMNGTTLPPSFASKSGAVPIERALAAKLAKTLSG